MAVVAVDQLDRHPLLRDRLARRILPGGTRALVALTRVPPIRRLLVGLSERRFPGIWGGMLCRKRYIDDVVVRAVAGGAEAVVVLGAGMDTRAYRLPELARTPVYELDLPSTIERKRARIRRVLGSVPDHVTLVPVDLETEDLAGTLTAAGHRLDRRTVFVWEGVTQYLSQDGIRRTLEFLSAAPPGSELVFTYIRRDYLDGANYYGAEAAFRDFVIRRRMWRFGLHPYQVAGLLDRYGWREVEQLGPAEAAARYVEPSGRRLSVSEIERTVLAERV